MVFKGTLERDPELRYTMTGKAVAIFTIQDTVGIIHRVVAWESAAERVTQTYKRGDKVSLSGYPKTRTWKNREGKEISVVELIVTEIK
jgi:single-strand DNA-binding protein